jgi:hypothetical protein
VVSVHIRVYSENGIGPRSGPTRKCRSGRPEDAGVVEASRGANKSERVQVELEPGASIEVAVEIPPELMLVPVAVAPLPVEVPPPAEPLVEQWWFWTIIGGVLVAAAIGIGIGVAVGTQGPGLASDRGGQVIFTF